MSFNLARSCPVTFLPHVLAINVATLGNFLTWDNRNPRSSDLKAQLKQRLPAVTYVKYERMEACHTNGMEVRTYKAFVHLAVELTMTESPSLHRSSHPRKHGWAGAERAC